MQRRNNRTQIILASLLVVASPLSIAAPGDATPDQAVSAIEGTFGVVPGQRRNHTKGMCALGEFVGSAAAQAYSSSVLFSGKPVPVVARFSLSGGNPKAPDTAKSARGMALEFKLPDGKLQHITMLNVPMFGAMTPQTFVDLMTAAKPDPATRAPDPEKMKAFRATHPDAQPQTEYMGKNNPPVSYANSDYFGIHTFKFINSKKETTMVRWRFVPQDGVKRLTDEELKSSPPDFLEQALIDRTKKGPARWDMIVSFGQAGDSEDNPTVLWPEGRKQVNVGTLTITSAMAQQGAACEKINYDPLVMSDGMAPTNDPILLFRSPSYALSFAKRLGGN